MPRCLSWTNSASGYSGRCRGDQGVQRKSGRAKPVGRDQEASCDSRSPWLGGITGLKARPKEKRHPDGFRVPELVVGNSVTLRISQCSFLQRCSACFLAWHAWRQTRPQPPCELSLRPLEAAWPLLSTHPHLPGIFISHSPARRLRSAVSTMPPHRLGVAALRWPAAPADR